MKILTAPSQDGHGYSVESADLPQAVYKLGKIEYKSYQLIEEICDDYCKYPSADLSQADLDERCDRCPLNKLHDIIYREGPRK